MLSRKYYKKLAEIFKYGYSESYKQNAIETGKIENSSHGNLIAQMQWKLIEFLKEDNPRFDEDKFIKAMDVDLKEIKIWYETEEAITALNGE
tara:strand:- start:107 stop:382 length:276 start_codon:yes stop_codon:yes gene_type:complete